VEPARNPVCLSAIRHERDGQILGEIITAVFLAILLVCVGVPKLGETVARSALSLRIQIDALKFEAVDFVLRKHLFDVSNNVVMPLACQLQDFMRKPLFQPPKWRSYLRRKSTTPRF